MPDRSSEGFPDQGRKLHFLLHEWGDAREADPKRRNHVLQADAQGRIASVRRVDRQARLAAAVGEEAARISVWMNDRRSIPPEALDAICRFYAVDARAFRILRFDEFVEVLRTGVQWPAWSRWRRLLAAVALPGLRQTTRDPALAWTDPAGGPDLRHAYVPTTDGQPALPEIAAGTPFWLALSSPQGEAEDDAWAWAGWHVLLVSRDCRTDGFASLPAAPVSGVFPNARTLYLPTDVGLRHHGDDLGVFEIVAVLAHASFPDDIVAGLSAGDGQGLLIEPALHKLAVWLDSAGQDAALRCLRYRSVSPRQGSDPRTARPETMTGTR